MLDIPTTNNADHLDTASGEFLTIAGERYYAIKGVDLIAPFLVSVVSSNDHWLFVSSTGGLAAGRVSPEQSLFPYVTVDKIHESAPHTGPKTLIRVDICRRPELWEPFNREHDGRFSVTRNLYKSQLGDKILFEEVNHDLQMAFRCGWATSSRFGFSRQCELQNVGEQKRSIEILDGLQNILPAGTPGATQANASNLVDAYKWTELDEKTGLATYSLYSGISDRAEPSESLRANTVFCLGLTPRVTLVSSNQIRDFRAGLRVTPETHTRGIRGAYLVNTDMELSPGAGTRWQIVADVERSQPDVVALHGELGYPDKVAAELTDSIARGSDDLARLMATADSQQLTAEEEVVAHHYANTLFNVLRGGIFADQYNIATKDFADTLEHFNRSVRRRHMKFLDSLPDDLHFSLLLQKVRDQDDPQLERLAYEYLPLTFGRRHGDPSRPWNKFNIKLKDDQGRALYFYEGNWRDVFQNWEALTFSYPEFIENVIARFVNASTMDGYNPYRVTKEGIDWEVEEPDDPWSYIGYWGDHQIIYLLKLLELSSRFHPARLDELLHRPIFSYANVPYRIKSFDALVENPKNTVEFDHDLAGRIEQLVQELGADGKLILDGDGEVYRVTLLEKLLVPLLSKLGNLVVDGGIWLNTQRPEWNDANNALVGHGLSMVTVNYLRRYIRFLIKLLAPDSAAVEMSVEVGLWLTETAAALRGTRAFLGDGTIAPRKRMDSMQQLGRAASAYREAIYRRNSFSGKTALSMDTIVDLLNDAVVILDHCIETNKRDDGLYNAYNLLHVTSESALVDSLYPMLEGQVAALSSGEIGAENACELLDTLFNSEMYRTDQKSFMLYPDRDLPGFLDKNRIPAKDAESIPILQKMLATGDQRLVARDADGCYRFNSDFTNIDDLNRQIGTLLPEFGDEIVAATTELQEIYEKVFNHRAFTGRSGSMFGFEGLGCIYWHMVSKLLLAVQENFFAAVQGHTDDATCQRLGQLYYRVREGIGFNKSPAEYGAFPNDPYSHTPKHAGAQQPGMTGQVKEEILTRLGELGVQVDGGIIHFEPSLLRRREFLTDSREFCYLDVDDNWRITTIPIDGIGFTWCQVPIVYQLIEDGEPSISLTLDSGQVAHFDTLSLPPEESAELFLRSGRIRQVVVTLHIDTLFQDTEFD